VFDNIAGNMLEIIIEHVYIKFHAELNQTTIEKCRMLNEDYGKECLSRARVFEWHERFSNGREVVEDDDRPVFDLFWHVFN